MSGSPALDVAAVCRRAAGRFIVLEGIDGAGTTTQGQALRATFERWALAASFTQEPSALPLGRLIRGILTSEPGAPSPGWDGMALLFAADRLEHVAQEIEPALGAGVAVICDRYDLSSYVYQSATSRDGQEALPWLRAINRRARRPDVTLIFDVEPAVAERRRALRGGRPELFERAELQRRLAELYARGEALVPEDRVLHVDANGTPEEVESRVLNALATAFGA